MKLDEFVKHIESSLLELVEEEWSGFLQEEENTIHISQLISCPSKKYYSHKYPEIVKRAGRSAEALLGIKFEIGLLELIQRKYPDAVSNYPVEIPIGKRYKLIGRLDIAIPDQKIFFEAKKLTYPLRLSKIYNEREDLKDYIKYLEEKIKTSVIIYDELGVLLSNIRDHYKEQLALYKYISDFEGHFIVEASIEGKLQRIIIINSNSIEPYNDQTVITLIDNYLRGLSGEFIPPRYEWNCWYGNPPVKCLFYDICENPYKKPIEIKGNGGEHEKV